MRELRLSDLKEQARRKAQLQSAGHGRLATVPDTKLLARLRFLCYPEAFRGLRVFFFFCRTMTMLSSCGEPSWHVFRHEALLCCSMPYVPTKKHCLM